MLANFSYGLRKCWFSARLGGGGEKTVFPIFPKKLPRIKKIVRNKKDFNFYSGHFEKKLSPFFVDFRHKSLVFFSIFHAPPPPRIFQTKHIGIAPTVQIFCFNDFPSSKNLFNDLGTQKAHIRTRFARGR